MTPEGKVKAAAKRILSKYPVYGWWPVPIGYGENSLDYVGCINGVFFAIETKAPGKSMTARQVKISKRICRAGGHVFVIDGSAYQLEDLEAWLKGQSGSAS